MPTVLTDQQNNGFGPISKKRGQKSTFLAFTLMLLFCAMGGFYLNNMLPDSVERWSFSVMAIAVSISGAVLGELVRRICLFSEEYGHIETR